jgi:RimJ/RimL family protein N-acetyltransferase
MISGSIDSDTIILTALNSDHVTARYQGWMNDPRITQYLESRFSPLSLDQLSAFVEQMRESSDSYFFAIISRDTGLHVGNIKLGPIDPHHLRAPIGLVIGDASVWGRGVATEAIRALSGWAMTELGLEKLNAGAYASNRGSVRAFEKAGFRVEGRQRAEVALDDGTRDDVVLLGLTRREFGEV